MQLRSDFVNASILISSDKGMPSEVNVSFGRMLRLKIHMPLSEEIKIEAFTKGDLKSREIPIEYRQRVGDVKLSSWKDGWRNLSFLFKKRFGLAEPES